MHVELEAVILTLGRIRELGNRIGVGDRSLAAATYRAKVRIPSRRRQKDP